MFAAGEQYLTTGTFTDDPGPGASDYTGQQIFYRSIRERAVDHLSVRDYLWRWDTDWFWCSRVFGVQHPVVRRLWPRRLRRSDVYRRLVALDRRTGLSSRIRRLARQPQEEPVIQDVEIPVERLAEFLDAFHTDIGITPVWLCPLRLRGERTWPLYPMRPGELYVNVGFWSAVPRFRVIRSGTTGGSRAWWPSWAGTSRCTRRSTTARRSSGSTTTDRPIGR